jgi:hypothetical protein
VQKLVRARRAVESDGGGECLVVVNAESYQGKVKSAELQEETSCVLVWAHAWRLFCRPTFTRDVLLPGTRTLEF